MGEIDDIIKKVSPYYAKKGGPEASHELAYDSSTETLEPVYFWLLEFMKDFGLNPEKLVDTFTSSPGSGHFSELGQRATIMQQQGAKIMGDVNTVLRSVLNVIYDLKEFRIRLEHYDHLKSSDSHRKDAALMSLKQIWMDKVDVTKGNSSLKGMALGQAGFVTLLDAFLAAKDEKAVSKLDLNDRVKRILKPRIQEFQIWLSQSEAELRKRYELEKTYLRSQVNALKLYSRWAKPYLKSAQELEQKDQGRSPDLVKTFNTILLELTLLGKRKLDINDLSFKGDLPKEFSDEKFLKTLKRDYFTCVLMDFNFRGIPSRAGQQAHYVFGGKVIVTFKAYALNSEEIQKLDQELEKSDVGDVLRLVEGATTESLEQMQGDIDSFLKEENKDEKPKETSNPFKALLGFYDKGEKKPEDKKDKKKDKKEIGKIKPDNWIEKEHLRAVAANDSIAAAYLIMDKYKKGHGMASFT